MKRLNDHLKDACESKRNPLYGLDDVTIHEGMKEMLNDLAEALEQEQEKRKELEGKIDFIMENTYGEKAREGHPHCVDLVELSELYKDNQII